MSDIEHHPWNWYCPKDCKILVIGTFPTREKNWSFDFFYPNTKNLFWAVLAHLVPRRILHFHKEEEVLAIQERKDILNDLKLGITDMGKEIRRLKDTANDNDLELVELMSIDHILKENPTIETLILTSSSGKNSALSWFGQFCKQHHYPFEYRRTNLPFYGSSTIKEKEYRVVVIRSTSPQGFGGMREIVPVYIEELARVGITLA